MKELQTAMIDQSDSQRHEESPVVGPHRIPHRPIDVIGTPDLSRLNQVHNPFVVGLPGDCHDTGQSFGIFFVLAVRWPVQFDIAKTI